jgi:hypothetical protein
MGYANVDEDAHAMPPPPPPVNPMQPQWEPPAGNFDPYFANIQLSITSLSADAVRVQLTL